nr:hypothetical protein [Tanacetum cinerariifolium]
MNDPVSLVFLRSLFSSGSLYDLAKASAQLFLASGFNQSGFVLILRRCTVSVSSESEIFTLSGIGTSLTGFSERGADSCLEELEGGSLVSDVFQAMNCGAQGCFDPEAS